MAAPSIGSCGATPDAGAPGRESRVIPLTLDHWTFFSAKLTGLRAADLNLYLRKANARRALARGAGTRSREHVERVLAPGRYEVEVFASRQRRAREPASVPRLAARRAAARH